MLNKYPRICRRSATGFTLIEALIAVTMTLVIMLALAQGFKRLSGDISQGRARLALSDQLRGVSEILRSDLSGLTVEVDPNSKVAKSGYFLYYEGPLSDHHPVTVPINNRARAPDATIEQNLSTSKYGDYDDILMFTARSKGDWFRGRVPLALVKGAASGGSGTYVPTALDWVNTVVVASEYAEIAYFMMPAIEPTPNPAVNHEEYVADVVDLRLPIVDRDSPVNPTTMPAYFTVFGNAIPDSFNLCRRVLLILPTLNLPTEMLINTGATPSGTSAATAHLQSLPLNNSKNSRLALMNAYQRCDLSVRRAASPIAGTSPIVANSLSDLANPMNRFAHITLPGTIIGAGANDRTMPILSLSGISPLQQYALHGGDMTQSPQVITQSPQVSFPARADGTLPEAGFMRPEFLKRAIDTDASSPMFGSVLLVENPETGNDVEKLTNEEVIATNCVAFDLKGYDPVARLLYHAGEDGLPNASTGWANLGAPGTDDLVLSPGDPGYGTSDGTSVGYLGASTPATLAQITASQGTFVDIGWNAKTPLMVSSLSTTARLPIKETSLSGFTGLKPTDALHKAGRVFGRLDDPTMPNYFIALIYQPCFDSYTDYFEHDGFRQGSFTSAANNQGTIFYDGRLYLEGLPPSAANRLLADHASNGLDDDSNGLIDDYAEQDSSPPILSAMPTIQALIRLEDKSAGVIQQIAVTQDLTAQ
ncbi:MAG: hypothetical protein SGI77_24750 [Pirellulaceae bacterium]|nr:hypothetical protein [Pirellulaceae bacterium]